MSNMQRNREGAKSETRGPYFKVLDKIEKIAYDDIGKFSKFEREVDLNADKKRMWIPAIGIKSINTKIMNVSIPLNLGILTKSQL